MRVRYQSTKQGGWAKAVQLSANLYYVRPFPTLFFQLFFSLIERSALLSCSSRFLPALQQNRAQSRLLYLLNKDESLLKKKNPGSEVEVFISFHRHLCKLLTEKSNILEALYYFLYFPLSPLIQEGGNVTICMKSLPAKEFWNNSIAFANAAWVLLPCPGRVILFIWSAAKYSGKKLKFTVAEFEKVIAAYLRSTYLFFMVNR